MNYETLKRYLNRVANFLADPVCADDSTELEDLRMETRQILRQRRGWTALAANYKEDFEPDPRGVVELKPDDPKATTCGTCGRGWDDTVSTSCTPVPSARCPFECDHESGGD